MFLLIENKRDIALAHKKLSTTIKREFSGTVYRDIGWQNGRQDDARLQTSGRYWYWCSELGSKEEKNPRRLNWFGVYGDGPGVQISIEINTPFEGRNDSIAGFFAKDTDTGRVYLFHSGRIGGGKKGVNRESFLAWCGLSPQTIIDSNGDSREAVLVMPIEGKGATRPLIAYIAKVIGFKNAVRSGKHLSREVQKRRKVLGDYFREASGRRQGRRTIGEIDYVSRHGDVVDALANWLTKTRLLKGERLTKDALIDLGIKRGGKLIELYEVKTSVVRSALYTAIGQLAVHAVTKDCKLFVVLPADETLAPDLVAGLERNSIETIGFRLTEDSVELPV